MNNFYNQEEYSFSDIQSLLDNEVEESIFLDFKSADALGKTDGKKKEISKDISAFANSEGGIIVYGISEINHKAAEISFVDGSQFTKEWIEHVINSGIQRRIDDLKIIPIRHNNMINETIYLIKIPKSESAPHQSRDKRFYKRYNFESIPMDEHEIRQLYGRKSKSKLVIENCQVRQYKDEYRPDKYCIYFEVDIYNDGDISENEYKVNVIIEECKPEINLSWIREKANYDYTVLEKGRVKVSTRADMPIFPGETVTAIRFTIELPKEKRVDLRYTKEQIRLLYSSGEDRLETRLIQQLVEKLYSKESQETI